VILTYKGIPLGLAIIFWGFGFYFGIAQIQNHEMAIQLNINELSASVKGKPFSKCDSDKKYNCPGRRQNQESIKIEACFLE
jgi:hypothetical protein